MVKATLVNGSQFSMGRSQRRMVHAQDFSFGTRGSGTECQQNGCTDTRLKQQNRELFQNHVAFLKVASAMHDTTKNTTKCLSPPHLPTSTGAMKIFAAFRRPLSVFAYCN